MKFFTIAPLTGHTGTEVGPDFAWPIHTEGRATFLRVFAGHHLPVMRGQRCTPVRFSAAARVFGGANLKRSIVARHSPPIIPTSHTRPRAPMLCGRYGYWVNRDYVQRRLRHGRASSSCTGSC